MQVALPRILLGGVHLAIWLNGLFHEGSGLQVSRACRKLRPHDPLLIVGTRANSTLYRSAIRRQGSADPYINWNTLFTISLEDDLDKSMEALKAEDAKYNDILILDKNQIQRPMLSTSAQIARTCQSYVYPNQVVLALSETMFPNFHTLNQVIPSLQASHNWRELGKKYLPASKPSAGVSLSTVLNVTRPFMTTVNVLAKISEPEDQDGILYWSSSVDRSRSVAKRESAGLEDLIGESAKQFLSLERPDLSHSSPINKCDDWVVQSNWRHRSYPTENLESDCAVSVAKKGEDKSVSRIPLIVGSIYRGPALPKFTWDQAYCRQISGLAFGLLTPSQAFETRRKFRKLAYAKQIVFPVGISAAENIDSHLEALRAEQEEFGDLIIGNYFDHYYTLSSKTMMTIKWFTECSAINKSLRWLMKTDDDVYINYRVITNLLNDIWNNGRMGTLKPSGVSEAKDMLLKPQSYPYWVGKTFPDYRFYLEKSITHRNYDDLNMVKYPQYNSGPLYAVNLKMADILLYARLSPVISKIYFRNEDAMLGILVAWLNDQKILDLPIYPFRVRGIYSEMFNYDWEVCYDFSLHVLSGTMSIENCDCTRVLAAPNPEHSITYPGIDKCVINESTPLPPVKLSSRTNMRGRLPKVITNCQKCGGVFGLRGSITRTDL